MGISIIQYILEIQLVDYVQYVIQNFIALHQNYMKKINLGIAVNVDKNLHGTILQYMNKKIFYK